MLYKWVLNTGTLCCRLTLHAIGPAMSARMALHSLPLWTAPLDHKQTCVPLLPLLEYFIAETEKRSWTDVQCPNRWTIIPNTKSPPGDTERPETLAL